MSSPTAIVTMVYNEPDYLPLWLKYYAQQFGASCCYVVDHGSTDGTTSNLDDVNVIRIPRSPMNDRKRATFISQLCSSLLCWYDTVIYTDVDEFLVPDPESYPSLRAFCAQNNSDVVWAVGLNIYHVPDAEPPINQAEPILKQRRWARFTFAMCKPLITRVATNWKPGFHSCEAPMKFSHVFLFHLRHYDLTTALRRLAKTRSMEWGDAAPDHYQMWDDNRYIDMINAITGLPKVTETTFRPNDTYINRYTQMAMEYVATYPDQRHSFYHEIKSKYDELLKVPHRFANML